MFLSRGMIFFVPWNDFFRPVRRICSSRGTDLPILQDGLNRCCAIFNVSSISFGTMTERHPSFRKDSYSVCHHFSHQKDSRYDFSYPLQNPFLGGVLSGTEERVVPHRGTPPSAPGNPAFPGAGQRGDYEQNGNVKKDNHNRYIYIAHRTTIKILFGIIWFNVR